jgi:hypothetical protein
MASFTYLYNFGGITILYYYYRNNNINDLIYRINHHNSTLNSDLDNIVYIIMKPINENADFDSIKNKNIVLLESTIDFGMFFNLHLLRHDYLYKNNIQQNKEKILEAFNLISVSGNNSHIYKNNLNNNLSQCETTIEIIKNIDTENKVYEQIVECKPIEYIDYYNELLEEINNFLIVNIDCYKNNKVDFKEYASMYNFGKYDFIHLNCISNNIVLENVYYINKLWFDKDKNPLNLDVFYDDFEYGQFKNHCENTHWKDAISDITDLPNCQVVEEEVMFLDYIYGFYNFGEFWDVIKRLLLSKRKNLPLFHLEHNRITNIKYYFDKLEFKYPTNYKKTERSNKLYYFNKVHVSLPKNVGSRGHIERNFAYQFNKLLNPTNAISEKTYNIYLARGQYGRSIINEEQIVNVLKEKYNFIVLNGTESLEETMHYFTNAKIILGAHGSLMKNMIWSKKNLILIELCPPSRANLDMYGNARELGFLAFFILTDSDKNEQIILNDLQVTNLYKLLDNI